MGIDKKRKTCMLYLQADHLFYETMTRHVQRVNSIYQPMILMEMERVTIYDL